MSVINLSKNQIFAEGLQYGSWAHFGYFGLVGISTGAPWFKLGVGLHFPLGTTIIQHSVINSATLKVWVGNGFNGEAIYAYIKAQLVASPSVIADYSDYITRRGLTPGGGVSDTGLVTAAKVDIVAQAFLSGSDYSYGVTDLISELAAAYDFDSVEMFLDDHNGRTVGPQDVISPVNSTLVIDYGPPPPVGGVHGAYLSSNIVRFGF